ncbi:hypothetical protein [Mitsuaria sp. 7]|uniref:hypothetical protein n=1 Tax=Mitsuaria sp. 7 TaxID=1658665 RepID=UPI0007DD216A|nr:hypothetical protein [Mitsuaria sp. 7]ANH66623.1 hypothetical protein ABE85_01890 [Mitsuaria sp. 7]
MSEERLVFRSITVEPAFNVELRAQAQAAGVTNGQMFRRILHAGFERVYSEGAFTPPGFPAGVRPLSKSVLILDEVDNQLRAWAFETHCPKSDVLRYVLWRGLESVRRSAPTILTRVERFHDTYRGPTADPVMALDLVGPVIVDGRSSPVLKAPAWARAALEPTLDHLKGQGVSHLEVFPFHRPGERDYWLAFAFVASERHTLGTSDLRHQTLQRQLTGLASQLAEFDAKSSSESKRLMRLFD